MNTKAALIELYDEVCGYLKSDCLRQEDIAHMLEFKYELIDRITEYVDDCKCGDDCQTMKDLGISEADLAFLKAINDCATVLK